MSRQLQRDEFFPTALIRFQTFHSTILVKMNGNLFVPTLAVNLAAALAVTLPRVCPDSAPVFKKFYISVGITQFYLVPA
jgi:hypothetical protein